MDHRLRSFTGDGLVSVMLVVVVVVVAPRRYRRPAGGAGRWYRRRETDDRLGKWLRRRVVGDALEGAVVRLALVVIGESSGLGVRVVAHFVVWIGI
ncbi:hypothetical protein ACLB2K_027980 [Fragaria x ananassa]